MTTATPNTNTAATSATIAGAASPAAPLVLYRMSLSGHSHRVQLFLSLLGLPHRLVDVDLRGGEHLREPFRRLNPFGQVPVLDDNGTILADSNAILVYLAMRYDDGRWLPHDPAGAAAVQRWLSVAAGEIAFGPATARLANLIGAPVDADAAIARARRLFDLMEPILAATPYLTGATPTLADVAAYSYIARAEEGNVPLAPYPALAGWLRRVESLPGFVPMPATPIGLLAAA
ncbi:glutathione S-transferase family protein [Cupriavidus basilensis]|uniref:Glutathione S-transferase family protein n=1 Tax=Cupriavidus basilensis TaxID=68895 RepID=A0ABT6AMP6_9BURK|nr:glutathione S-transferase family protein [Cupriavidus basilensis]MDF3833577.1 glutathione S-transferase family protein [Cupriavidus basilensis]